MIKAVLFDFDGTLFDTEGAVMESFRYMLSVYGVKNVSQERLRSTFGALIEDIMQEFVEEFSLDADIEEMIEIYRQHHFEHFEEDVRVFDGIKELLCALQEKGIRMSILTSRRQRSTMRGLDNYDMKKYFEVIRVAGSSQYAKPDARAATEVTDMMGLDPRDCIIIGDSAYDLQCGINAGMYTALAMWGTSLSEEEIKGFAPSVIAKEPMDLARYIEKVNG